MDYLDEYDLVDEAAAGFPGSSPRPISVFGGIIEDDDANDDRFLGSSPPQLHVIDDDLELPEADEFDDFDEDEGEDHGQDEIEIDSDDSIDSIDEIEESGGISFDSWDNNGGEDNLSALSSSPPESLESVDSFLSPLPRPARLESGDEGDHYEEDEDDVSLSFFPPAAEVEDAPEVEDDLDIYEEEENPYSPRTLLQGQFDRWQQQHQELVESRQRIADTLIELTQQRIQDQARVWHDTLESQRARRGFRQALTSGSSVRDRLHPYRAPSPRNMSTDLGPSRRSERGRNSGTRSNDELVQVEVEGLQPQTRRRQTQSSGRPARTEAATRSVAVIDLTEEPDSPEGPRNGTTHSRARMPSASSFQPLTLPSTTGRAYSNPRRQMSLNHRTPSLTRSDASLLGNRPAPPQPADVIDLTMDDDSPPARNAPAARPAAPRRHARAVLPPNVHPIEVEAERGNNAIFGFLHRIGFGIGTTFFGTTGVVGVHDVVNPLGDNRPNFNYQANGYNNGGRGGPSKPVHEPPTKAREGFARNTSSSEEEAFVCPACEEELTYDPDVEEPASPRKGGPAPKKAKNRKDREEHHFWAVKECGHVFCKKCFDGRKPTKAHKSQFRSDPEHPRRVICAVDDCKSDVSNKSAWVGLFL